ncbi:hypothetical protein [Pyrobaculum sp.]|uniref:hypothetical protein n=1 Tax=Pyrobaculum sp. TaxID=2004705 RepID=UPI0031671E98
MLVVAGQYTSIAGPVTTPTVNGHVIGVVLDKKGKPQYNITSLAELLAKYNTTALTQNASCSCCANTTAPALPNVAVNVDVVVNKTWSRGGANYTFFFAGVTATNGTANYTAYLLLYKVVGGQGSGHYNFSTVTVILTKPSGEYALTRVDVMPFKKNVTAVEYVVIKNATTLADSYRIIVDALQQVKSDSPRAWDIAHKELTHLAKLVEKEIPQYNKKAPTVATVTDAIVCVFPGVFYCFLFDCLQMTAPYWVVVGLCCATIYGIILSCPACATGFGCATCIASAVLLAWGTLAGCWDHCLSMQLCVAFGCWGPVLLCTRLW